MRLSDIRNYFPDPPSMSQIFKELALYWGGSEAAVHLLAGEAGSGKSSLLNSLLLDLSRNTQVGLIPLENGSGLGLWISVFCLVLAVVAIVKRK